MTKPTTNPRQTARVVQLRKGATVEMVRLTCDLNPSNWTSFG
ncbi:hypothetical protein [Rhizobium leguminosarum]|nr:hypothetical protein [Rhizobium leguminosarum]